MLKREEKMRIFRVIDLVMRMEDRIVRKLIMNLRDTAIRDGHLGGTIGIMDGLR